MPLELVLANNLRPSVMMCARAQLKPRFCEQLRALLAPLGRTVIAVPLGNVLHLKSAVTALPDGTFLLLPELVNEIMEAINMEMKQVGASFISPDNPSGLNTAQINITSLGGGLMTVDFALIPCSSLDSSSTCNSISPSTTSHYFVEALMNQAGAGVAQAVAKFSSKPGKCIVFAGKGHNAGDALVAAERLRRLGWEIEVRLAFKLEDCSELMRKKLEELRRRPPQILGATPSRADSTDLGITLLELYAGVAGELAAVEERNGVEAYVGTATPLIILVGLIGIGARPPRVRRRRLPRWRPRQLPWAPPGRPRSRQVWPRRQRSVRRPSG